MAVVVAVLAVLLAAKAVLEVVEMLATPALLERLIPAVAVEVVQVRHQILEQVAPVS